MQMDLRCLPKFEHLFIYSLRSSIRSPSSPENATFSCAFVHSCITFSETAALSSWLLKASLRAYLSESNARLSGASSELKVLRFRLCRAMDSPLGVGGVGGGRFEKFVAS